ncbi:hypothetical protein PC123_g1981 [Phytophthora cactorum]|nr:hypothetical protein PC123_g1981 [Phytophthora cactorum]
MVKTKITISIGSKQRTAKARGVSGSHTTGNTTRTTTEAKCKSYRYEDPQSSGGTEASTIESILYQEHQV